MTQIVELKGTEKRLYQLVAPLVMNPVVLKQNYNYPFRTSENFIWFVAVEGKEIVALYHWNIRNRKQLLITII